MKQLTGLDASFLYAETPNAPMHISGLSIYDQSTAPGGKVRFKEIIRNTNNRLMGLPVMTQKLLKVPLNFDHPPTGSPTVPMIQNSTSGTSHCPSQATGVNCAL